MKLTILCDNNTIIDSYYVGEPAVSYFIECSGRHILFDTGYSDVYLRNAAIAGIDLSELDALVLSHAHNDHTGGLRFFPAQKEQPLLIAHPLLFERRVHDGLEVGSPLSASELSDSFRLKLTSEPYELAPQLYYLGEIPRRNDFENKKPVGSRYHRGELIPDFLPDDSALAYVGKNGLSIISGCSHGGICNIIDYAKELFHEERLQSVIGGFHLMDPASPQLRRTADYLARSRCNALYPCHCTCFEARAAIHAAVPIREVGSGMTLEWE